MTGGSHLKADAGWCSSLFVCGDMKYGDRCESLVGREIYNLRDNNLIATRIYHLKGINNVEVFHVAGKKTVPTNIHQ